MNGFWYQLKITAKDKMSILSFFLPLVMAAAINILTGSDLHSMTSYRFAILAEDHEVFNNLSEFGIIKEYESLQELIADVNNPNDDTIGIITDGREIEILLSGDERSDTITFSHSIPDILSDKLLEDIEPASDDTNIIAEFKNLFIGLVIITALFLGLTFNTMNIVSEKEDGIIHVNEVLPMSPIGFLIQKIAIGFIGSVLLATLTAVICVFDVSKILSLLPLLIFGGITVSIAGVFLGQLSGSLISALAYVKAAMLIFMAMPVIAYMFVPEHLKYIFHLLPSYTILTGTIGILEHTQDYWHIIAILLLQSVLSVLLCLFIQKRKPTL